MDFSATKYEKFKDTVSDSTVQLAFKKLVEFWCNINEECVLMSEKTNKMFPLPFQL